MSIALALLLGMCGIFLCLPHAQADERIPPLGFIPPSITGSERTQLTERRQALQAQLSANQAAAFAFNSEPADRQTDAEYNALSAKRESYINDANAFNRDLTAAVAAVDVRAALPVAYVHASGEFHFVTRDGRTVTGAEAAKLPMDGGTRAMTGPNGRIQLLLPDQTMFTLGPNSDMVLDDYVYDVANSVTTASARLARGTIRWVTGKISYTKNMNLKVAVGTIGIRGTDFEAKAEPSGAGYVKLFEGQLDITENKTGAKIQLHAGQMISFAADGSFGQPSPLNP